MMARHFTTSSQPDGRKLAWWQDVLSDVYYNLEVFSDHRDGLRARIDEQLFGPASITLFDADNQRVLRTSSRIACDDNDSFVLVMPRGAPLYYSQLGRNGFIPPDGYVLVQTREYYELSCPDNFGNVTVKLPGDLVRRHLPFAEDHCAARFRPDPALGRTLRDFALWLVGHADTLPPALAQQMGQQLVELLVALLSAEAGPGDADTAGAVALRRRIDRHVRDRLLDPALTPAAVADHFGISASYLHRIFRPAGMTLGRWIHQARLQRGYELLTHQGHQHLSIAAIAYAVSFGSQAHFTTSFRKQFKVTPGEARQLARQSTYLDRLRGRVLTQ